MQIANEGDTRPFIRFIADCTEKTLDLFLWATSELSHQIPLLSDPDLDDYEYGSAKKINDVQNTSAGTSDNLTTTVNNDD